MKKHYRVVSIPRFTIFVVLSTLLFLASIYSIGNIYRSNAGTVFSADSLSNVDSDMYTEVTVTSGDTLWSIAREFYGSQVDKRQAVYEIQSLNHLADTSLYAGQIILLPREL